MTTEAAAAPPAFRFQQRHGKLDWRSLSQLDLDKVQRDVDIDTLERHLQGVAFANVTQEDLHWFTESSVAQLLRMLQMVVEYLLYVQEHLHGRNVALEKELAMAQQRESVLHAQLLEQAEYAGTLEQQLQQRKAVSREAVSSATAASCPVCLKVFATPSFLAAHMARRHPTHPPLFDPASAFPAAVQPPTVAALGGGARDCLELGG